MARDKALADKKNAFKVEHLGELLARHERFCLSRAGNQRVSPSVRWGLWWDILTGHRRGSGTRLAYGSGHHQSYVNRHCCLCEHGDLQA